MKLFDVVNDNLNQYIKLTHMLSMNLHGVRFADHLIEQTLIDYAGFMDDVSAISDNRLDPPRFPGSLIHEVARPTVMLAQDDLAYRTALADYNLAP